MTHSHRGPRLDRPTLVVLARASLAFFFLAIIAPPSVAADGPSITWSMRPANATGPDERTWVEWELDPGEAAGDHLAVSNLSKETVTFRLDAADGYFTPAGRFNMLPSGHESVGAGTWIDVAETVTVEAGATAVVPFTINVPGTAEPGDHAAGLAASLVSNKKGGSGDSVGVESRIGFRVMTRVTGELRPQLQLANVQASYEHSWNPFAPGDLRISGEAVNAGNTRLRIEGQAGDGRSAAVLAGPEGGPEMLPGDRRLVTATLQNVWPTGYVSADLTVNPTVVAMNGSQTTLVAATSAAGAWAIPWPQLLSLAGLLLVAFAIVGERTRARRKTTALIEAARNEGRRER